MLVYCVLDRFFYMISCFWYREGGLNVKSFYDMLKKFNYNVVKCGDICNFNGR